MFDKFGEFDSAEELNKAAEGLIKDGKEKEVYELAKENGIDKADVEDYMDGLEDEFVTPLMAAYGKLKVEAESLGVDGILKDWTDSIMQMCSEDTALAAAVRKKGKALTECLGIILKNGFEIKKQIPDEVVKAAGLRPPLYLGIPNRKAVEDMVKAYYLGK